MRSEGPLFNQAGQAWNHSFYWFGLSPETTTLDGGLKRLIEAEFGSFEKMRDKFIEKGVAQFGSGWVCTAGLKTTNNHLDIMTTSKLPENPMRLGRVPLLTCDVWEHAYLYVDFRNERKKYLGDFFPTRELAIRRFENLASPGPANMTKLM